MTLSCFLHLMYEKKMNSCGGKKNFSSLMRSHISHHVDGAFLDKLQGEKNVKKKREIV